ncbi:MAG: DUF6335 family protein [Acidobacteriota bacterium]
MAKTSRSRGQRATKAARRAKTVKKPRAAARRKVASRGKTKAAARSSRKARRHAGKPRRATRRASVKAKPPKTKPRKAHPSKARPPKATHAPKASGPPTSPAARRPDPASASTIPAAAPPPRRSSRAAKRPPTLDRERRRITDADTVSSFPSSLDLDRSASSVRTGRAELREKLGLHTSTSPAMTGGDVDADWASADSVGDEAPGGDNPTPDQDVVDDIGRALGVEYEEEEELQGGDEITDRDRHRWELDPASSDDFDDRDD